jgi:hypothetical protein
MNRRTITATLAAAMLALGAAACGDREQVEESNPGVQDPQGGVATQQEPASGITPTGEEQETVTQQEGGEGE